MSVGKQFEKDMLASLRAQGHWAERFRDNTWKDMGGSNQSPPDLIALIHGEPVLQELKAITTGLDGKKQPRPILAGAISVKRCQGHQLERLLDFQSKGGYAFVTVLYYNSRIRMRCAVTIPVDYWVNSPAQYGRDTVRLRDLRQDLPAAFHYKWMGRNNEKGMYVPCQQLADDPRNDVPLYV